ncbi:hypothetical protein OS493_001975 [Desmophyllum pertusum]|uniref:Uncharacterized protein n=1 Tax=Desmophyllum pertusum TaxID=174260 RepID=A0A9W9Z5B1_9CNID|nr:hypothetical protein OS493_001975 [Desmophyllum pertusum]
MEQSLASDVKSMYKMVCYVASVPQVWMVTQQHFKDVTPACVNGSIDPSQLKDCNQVDGKCFVCQSNDTGFSTKEKIIVAVCSTFGIGCIATTGFLIYRHFKGRRFSVKKPFWTVELTNRNYDDLDFSLLDPITDIPFVYRTDIGEFDNDALLGAENHTLGHGRRWGNDTCIS